ncbi:hypothetical protein GR702_17550 [Novosphingobium sp. FGD1]|uniref:Uncharacterized protein n=1 Tax=Novosphingobium silvae TaxID=2692619 RepID=A0A7X4GJ28_9SPHN|nr:hypothetical protein [Novosphingobium silvae]MYL99570.1 hypothetical protein [Novosphingobium silvae]
MDIKPNRPVRVGNKMLRSGAADSDFLAEVEAELATVAPVDEGALLRELAAGVLELQQLLVAQKAESDQRIADLSEAIAVQVTRHEALQVELGGLTERLVALEAGGSDIQGKVSPAAEVKQDADVAGGAAKKPATKAAGKASDED